MTLRLFLLGLLFGAGVTCAVRGAGAQQIARTNNNGGDGGARAGAPADRVANAVKAAPAIALDRLDRDPVWQNAPTVDDFRVYDPVENGEPTMRTEARFAYDDRNLYVLVRAFDPHPDSIRALLSRRDQQTSSDYIKVVIDSYHDRRTGYEFMVNPAGVQSDYYLYNDNVEDGSWDAVWEAKTRIDSLGWEAEFRIPLSQLRYPKAADHTFGIAIARTVARTSESSAWPLFRRSQFGIASQLGELREIRGIESPRRLEVLPYTVASNQSVVRGSSFGRSQTGTMGADIKYGVSSNLTLDATINPDFGQVEADPSVLNLSAFEQFYGEKRPFFLEGTGIFRFDEDCNNGQCTGLFYSRRIGRNPQLSDLSADANAVPTATRILGAGKITGRLSNGLSVGLLDAVTSREAVGDTLTMEPSTNYLVGRLTQELRQGHSGVGLAFTATNRALDSISAPYLRRNAYAGGFDFWHRFGPGNNYSILGNIAGSVVDGTAAAIALTQQSSVHLYQRPDDGVPYDSTRTSLNGYSWNLGLAKAGGGILRWSTNAHYRSPGFEINDVGFITGVNSLGWSNWLALVTDKPRAFYRNLQLNVNEWTSFLTDGKATGVGGNVNGNVTFMNQWYAYFGYGADVERYCASCLRGGPILRVDPSTFGWAGAGSDSRRAFSYGVDMSWGGRDGGRSFNYSVGPYFNLRVASQFSGSLGITYSPNTDDRQWIDNYGDVASDTTHDTIGHLKQRTLSLTTRLNYTATPTLSVQFYGQPFISAGSYSNWRQVSNARAPSYADRYSPFTLEGDAGANDFNFKQFRSNTVVRWEYRPGSTLYLVWSQGREQDDLDLGRFGGFSDYRNLFGAHPANTLLIKASYWLSL